MELVAVYEAPDVLLANSVRDLLLQNGIPAILQSREVEQIIGIPVSLSGSFGEVLVEPQDAERAEELIAGFLGTLGMLEEVPPE